MEVAGSSETLVLNYQITRRHFHAEEGSKLLGNVGNCTSLHGIISQNNLIFSTAVKPSDLQDRSSK
jgi:hypothetical protein